MCPFSISNAYTTYYNLSLNIAAHAERAAFSSLEQCYLASDKTSKKSIEREGKLNWVINTRSENIKRPCAVAIVSSYLEATARRCIWRTEVTNQDH